MVAEYHNQSKLRFWCQMVLPLVYDDSLSYMELLNKVINYLNNCIQDVGNCETNIELLLDAFESLQDYVNEMVEDISPEIESVIDQMIENGDFTEILTDALNTVVAPEYDEETTYLQYEYVLYEGNLYRANTTTSGEFDPTKWTEKTIAQDLTLLERYVYGLTANDIPYDGTQTYDAGSTGKAIKDLAAEVGSLDAGDIAYNSSTTYNNATVGKELGDLKGTISNNQLNVATVENTLIASRRYEKGEYVIVDGKLRIVIDTILQGDTFQNGTNILVTNVGAQMTMKQYSGSIDSDFETMGGESFYLEIYSYFRSFGIVFFNVYCPVITPNTHITVGHFPNDCKPLRNDAVVISGQKGGTYLLEFKTNGNLQIYCTDATPIGQFLRIYVTIPLNIT